MKDFKEVLTGWINKNVYIYYIFILICAYQDYSY